MNQQPSWDAIVVGAGPAGCAAAYDLVTAGLRTLLVDKSDFPRAKACAGGLTMKTVKALRYSIEPVTRQVVHQILLENNGSQPTLVKTRSPICVMTVREEFDAYCLRKTLAAGAQFRRIRSLKGIELAEDGITLLTADETFHARFLVGADGVHSQVRKFADLGPSTAGGFALEAQVPLPEHRVDLTFDFGAARNGYGWVFPKGDHLNVGMGFYAQSEGQTLNRETLLAYIRARLGPDAAGRATHIIGQYLGVRGWDQPCARGRVLLAGDAAGLVDPLTAEGIYSAVVSGQAAARAIVDHLSGRRPVEKSYAAGLKHLRDTLAFSTRAAHAFYANPDRGFQAMTLPGLRGAILKTYAHGLNSGTGILRMLSKRQAAG